MVTGPACTEVAVKRTVISAKAVNARSVCRRLANLVQSGGLGKFILFNTTRVIMARRLQHLGRLNSLRRLSRLDREVNSRRDIKKARLDLRSTAYARTYDSPRLLSCQQLQGRWSKARKPAFRGQETRKPSSS